MPRTRNISLRLLKTIKRFPELYNSQHDLANDKAHSMVVWDIISCELDAPVSVLKKKWQTLRSSHRKRCRNLKMSKSSAPLPRDDIFHLMYSMLDATLGDPPGDGDDSSVCSSTPTLSIISEEGGSSRSSRASTVAPVSHGARFIPTDSSEEKNPPKLTTKPGKSTSTRVLRSQNRATRSEGSELNAKNEYRVAKNQWKDSTPGNIENLEKSSSLRLTESHPSNDPIRTFFERIAFTVEKFPRHVQAVIKTKICNVVVEAELRLSPSVIR